MISKADRRLLNETYRNAGMAIEAIYTTIDKIEDEELALELTRQLVNLILYKIGRKKN